MRGIAHLALHHEHVAAGRMLGGLRAQQDVVGPFKLVATGQCHHARYEALTVLVVGTPGAGIDRGHAFAHLLHQCVVAVARTNVGQAGRCLRGIRHVVHGCGQRAAGDGPVRVVRVELDAFFLALQTNLARVVELGDAGRIGDLTHRHVATTRADTGPLPVRFEVHRVVAAATDDVRIDC